MPHEPLPVFRDCLSQLHPGCHLTEPDLPPLGIEFPIVADTGVLGTYVAHPPKLVNNLLLNCTHIRCGNQHLRVISVWEHEPGNWDIRYCTPWAMGNSHLPKANLGSG